MTHRHHKASALFLALIVLSSPTASPQTLPSAPVALGGDYWESLGSPSAHDGATPLWGYADYHTHPMTHLGFGGLKGVRTIWGRPGGRYEDYTHAPSLVAMDLPACDAGHGGGPFASPFLNAAQTLQYKASASLLKPHPDKGWPTYENFPSFIQGAHEQMHVTQIRRNYDGGLRLMVALATDNSGAEYLMSAVADGNHVPLVNERDSFEAQISGMKDLALLNADWMQIAYTPQEAREIIRHNKLAVILGIEMDQLGTYGCGTPAGEVAYLWEKGVRAVTPIHAADNLLGGAAVFIGPYNWLNDLLHRGKFDLTKKQLKDFPARFFEITPQACDVSSPLNDGECIQNRLEWDKQSRVYIGNCLVSFFQGFFRPENPLRTSPCLADTKWKAYDTTGGHANKRGLTTYGEQYIDALMAQGMILDTAHMSDKSIKGTFAAIGKKLQRTYPSCIGFPANTACDSMAYPAIISHAHFRGQAFYGAKDFVPSEYDISISNLDLVRRVGGVVGPFVAEDRISTDWDEPRGTYPKNDCAMSSKSFAYSYHYAAQRLGRYGVGMATDFTLIPGVSPRFGKNACWAYHLARNPDDELNDEVHSKYYDINAQRHPVVYRQDGSPSAAGLEPYRLGSHIFDYNTEGLAHFGLVPDMLQDLKNVGMPQEDLALLFRSAEDYIRMWERAFRLAQ